MEQKGEKNHIIFPPAHHIIAESIPHAHYLATKFVFENGLTKRTQYDRQSNGTYIDPPGKDASVLIQINNPFSQPRYPVISFSEVGTYLAEIAYGIKDHLVLTRKEILEGIKGENLGTRWPYTYHQRLFSYPCSDGSVLDQVDLALERLKKSKLSRRAVAITGVPDIDCFLEEDIPCLREIQLRLSEHNNELYLNLDTKWRSRDLFQAWPDNTLGLTFLQARLAGNLSNKIGQDVKVGSYTDYSSSLHIYGQSITEKGVENYVKSGVEKITTRAMTSDFAAENLVIPSLEKTLSEECWEFPESTKEQITNMIKDLSSGQVIA